MTTPEPTPGTSLRTGARTLACGADVDELLEQVADGRADQLTEHQRGCGYCQAALAEFGDLWAPVARSAASPVAMPAGLAGTLTATVMAGILNSPGGPVPAVPPAHRLPLRRWLQLAGVVAAGAVIAVVVLVSRHQGSHSSNSSPAAPKAPGTGLVTPSVPPSVAPSAAPSGSAPPATGPSGSASSAAGPSRSAPSRPAVPGTSAAVPSRYPTAVPAGTGGQAASISATTRNEELAALLAGLLLMTAGGGRLAYRRHRLHVRQVSHDRESDSRESNP